MSYIGDSIPYIIKVISHVTYFCLVNFLYLFIPIYFSLSLPGASTLMGAINSAMPLQGLPIDDGGLSDDEDSLKRKIPGLKQTAEAK